MGGADESHQHEARPDLDQRPVRGDPTDRAVQLVLVRPGAPFGGVGARLARETQEAVATSERDDPPQLAFLRLAMLVSWVRRGKRANLVAEVVPFRCRRRHGRFEHRPTLIAGIRSVLALARGYWTVRTRRPSRISARSSSDSRVRRCRSA